MPENLEIRATGIYVTDILELISRGFTYERILFTHESLTYEDIFQAAKLAKQLVEDKATSHGLEKIRRRHPRAYEKWTSDEEDRLTRGYQEGISIKELAKMLDRQPSAIQSRLARLGLTKDMGLDDTATERQMLS